MHFKVRFLTDVDFLEPLNGEAGTYSQRVSMSLFNLSGASSGPGSGSGSSALPALNLQVPTQDASGRKRSIFEAGTSHSASNLFGGLGGSSSSAQAPGAPGTTTSAPFNLLNPPTSGPSSNMFGNTTTTASPSIGLFGATNPSAPTNSMFGSTNQQTANPNLFSTTNQQTAPAQSAFGTSNLALGQTQSGGQPGDGAAQILNRDPAYFRSVLERQNKKGRHSQVGSGARAAQLPTLNMDLGDLARRAQEIGSRTPEPTRAGADSRAHYLLAGAGVTPGKAYRDFQAYTEDDDEVATQPIDFDEEASRRYIRDLPTKGREALAQEAMDRVHREVDAFIKETLNIDFEAEQKRIMEHFGIVPRSEDAGESEYRTSPGVRGSPGPKGSFARSAKGPKGVDDSGKISTRSIFGRSGMKRSMIGDPAAASTTSFFGEDKESNMSPLLKGQSMRDLRDKEQKYVNEVERLNEARLNGRAYPIIRRFAEVEATSTGESPRQIADAFQALAEIAKETELSPVGERKYANTYLNENSNSPAATRLKKQIIDGSQIHLEKAFFREVETLIERNPREAQLGGRPTVINKIRAYIRVRAARRDLAPEGTELQQIGDTGEFGWILIFYLIRSGHFNEALEYVENDAAFQSTDKRFLSYIKSYCNNADRKIGRKLQEMINGEYNQRAKFGQANAVDPYRMACYKVIGRCDLASRSLEVIGQGVEDWIWLQFSLARESDRGEELSLDTYGLNQIRETIQEIKEKHFQKGQVESSGGYGTCFFMLVLSGLFEDAVDYLHTFNPASAVHFAIALAYCGLLRVSDYRIAGNELCKFDDSMLVLTLTRIVTKLTTEQPQINFVPLIAYYTAAFRIALPVQAVDYITLICLNSDLTPPALGAEQTNACHECLRELCLETREFAQLLGDIRSDGTRITGAVEQKAPLINLDTREGFVKEITFQSAAIANERGQVADAVLLFHLSEKYDNVVSILNNALADAISLDLGESPLQLQPLKPRQNGSPSSPDSSRTVSDSKGPQSSLSLTQSTSSPVELARNMVTLYNSNAAYYNQISQPNRDTVRSLLQLLSARAHLESQPPNFMAALETINDLSILPLLAKGSIPAIRTAANNFGQLSPLLARCAGISVVWAVRAIGGERDNIVRLGSWDAAPGGMGDKDAMKEQLNGMAKDLMVFAGLVKYKLPGRVYDLLTRAGGDVGVY